MATAHLNPGYGDIVSRYRRVRSAIPAGSRAGSRRLQESMNMNVDKATLDDIKEKAKDMWLEPDRSQTSYGDHYKERYLELSDITQPRPTSASRHNVPHPSDVFLTTHLHTVPGYGRLQDIPGYQNPDTTLGKDAYRVDRSLPNFEQQYRNSLKSKYIGRPSTAAVNQFKTIEELDVIDDPIERQGIEAYIKLAPKQDQAKILSDLRRRKGIRQIDFSSSAFERSARPQPLASLHRYMKNSGELEADHVYNAYSHARGASDLGSMKQQDLEAMRRHRYVHPTKRGDYLIHPEWTPKFVHHRLNGLSTVDVPYMPGRR